MSRTPSQRFTAIGILWLLVLLIVGIVHVMVTGELPGNAEDRVPAGASAPVKPRLAVAP